MKKQKGWGEEARELAREMGLWIKREELRENEGWGEEAKMRV